MSKNLLIPFELSRVEKPSDQETLRRLRTILTPAVGIKELSTLTLLPEVKLCTFMVSYLTYYLKGVSLISMALEGMELKSY